MPARGVLPILIMLSILSLADGRCCDLSNATSLSRCLRKLLEAGRDSARAQVEPLPLPDATGTGQLHEWSIKNVTVTGLGKYSFESLEVNVENTSAIRIKFKLNWTSATLGGTGRFRFCRRIQRRRTSCVELEGTVSISVKNPAGSGAVLLELSQINRQLQAKTKRSQISVNFSNITVDVSLDRLNEKLDHRFGSPSKIFRSELIANYWNNNTEALVSDKMISHLRSATNVSVPVRRGCPSEEAPDKLE